MSTVTLPPSTSTPGVSTNPSSFPDSPNFTQENRARGRRARTAANTRSRRGFGSTPQMNLQRSANLRKARAAQTPTPTPQIPKPATPTAPLPKGLPAAGAGATGGAAATSSLWGAAPASVPVATAALGTAALATGLAVGNAIYEEVLGRPFGPSLGDRFPSRNEPQRDGPAQPYLAPGEQIPGGQNPNAYYRVKYTITGNRLPSGEPFIDQGSAGGSITNRIYGEISGIFVETLPSGDFDIYILGAEKYVVTRRVSDGYANLSVRIDEIIWLGGEPESPEPGPLAQPQPQPPSPPYQRPYSPQPQPQPTPTPQPQPQPQLQPTPTPTPAPTPYPENRPDPNASPNTQPFPPVIPALSPSPRPTPTPTPTQPPTPTPPPNSTRQRPNCGCNAGIISGVSQQLNPIRQAQQSQAAGLAAEAASTAKILDNIAKLQKFVETAWRSTAMDKVINALTLFTVLHNGAHLSRNLAETLGDVLSNGLSIIGIQDAEGSRIDVNEVVGTTTSNWLKALVGETIYEGTKATWLKLNRVYQSGANILFSVRSILDGAQEVAEWTAENTGKIGNSLKRSGVVTEDSFKWMPEQVNAQNLTRRKFDRIFDGIDEVDDKLSSLQNVTGEILSIQEEIDQIGEGRREFEKAVEDLAPKERPDNQPVANAVGESKTASESPEISDADLEPDE